MTIQEGESLPTITLWLLPEMAAFAARLVATGRFRCTRAGCPLKGQNVAVGLGAEPFDDLRAELAAPVNSTIVLLSPDGFGTGTTAMEDLQRVAAAAVGPPRVRVLTVEPIPARTIDLAGVSGTVPAAALPRVLGLPRNSAGLRAGTEWLESLEGIRAASMWCAAAEGEGTLSGVLARLADLLIFTMGEPESIDAAFVQPRAGRALHAAPGDSLSGLSGCVSILARFADGRVASLFGADHWPVSGVSANLAGAAGQITLTDGECSWHGRDGAVQRAGRTAAEPFARSLAAEIGAAIAADDVSTPPPPLESILLIGQAALLSARTGQPESLETIRMMSGLR